MFERPLVHEPCGRSKKIGGLAQVLQRRAPTWRDWPEDANYLAESRWRIQPATVIEPENSSLRRSKEWSQSKEPENSSLRRSKEWSQSNRKDTLIISCSAAGPAAFRCTTTLARAKAGSATSSWMASRTC